MIPKFKEGIRLNLHRELEGEPLFATVSRSTTEKHHVSITCETEHKPFQKTGKPVGVDTGIKKLAVLSDGNSYENIRSLKTKLKKLRFGQRQLSKKTRGSGSRGRQKRKLAAFHEQLTDIRKD